MGPSGSKWGQSIIVSCNVLWHIISVHEWMLFWKFEADWWITSWVMTITDIYLNFWNRSAMGPSGSKWGQCIILCFGLLSYIISMHEEMIWWKFEADWLITNKVITTCTNVLCCLCRSFWRSNGVTTRSTGTGCLKLLSDIMVLS